jgi:probable FeS assembly SUF system protein SufT
MQDPRSVELIRDCEATQIPLGTPAVLAAGTWVDITQTLGGSYTVQAPTGLFRVASKDADALGLNVAATPAGPAEAADGAGVGLESDQLVWDTLKTCFDPEIPVNIVDLGLVYDLRIEPLPSGSSRVVVRMTLTAPGCGMGPTIAGDAQQKLMALPGVGEADVQIVWDPPWNPGRISPAGRAVLGLD